MVASTMAAQAGGPFSLLNPQPVVFNDPTRAEEDLFAHAAAGRAVARLWHAPQSLVVPASYRRFADFEAARTQFAAAGCPVFVRKSGGGLVPQGPGIINLSLAFATSETLGDAAEAVYLHLCAILRDALSELGVGTGWQAVAGSFCDGRYNLACGVGEEARKIAGTAQYWRTLPETSDTTARRHVVLAHAILLVDCDLTQAHRWANQFETQIGSGRVYQQAKTVSVAQMSPLPEAELQPRLVQALTARLMRHPMMPGGGFS